jgi:hypothetical protein
MISYKKSFWSLVAASSLVCGVASATAFADDQFGGSLQVSGGPSITLNNTQDRGGGSVTLSSGPAQVTVSGAGWFNSAGSLTIATNTGQVKMKIYHSAYSNGDSFMAYGGQSGQPYNIHGIYTTTQSGAPPTTQLKSCVIAPQQLIESQDLSPYMPSPCPVMDQNGQMVTPPAAPDRQNLTFSFCESPAQQAGALSKITVVPQYGSCPGSQVETDQVVTTVNHYELDFIDPSTGKTIAVINSDDGGNSSNQFVSETDCQPQ